MITFREAQQRLLLHGMRISRVQGSIQVRVSFAEEDWRTAERSAFYTDCIEEAVIEGAKMRANKGYPHEIRTQEGLVSVDQRNSAAVRRWIATQARQDARRSHNASSKGVRQASEG